MRKIRPEEVYVSVLRAKRVVNKEGWSRMEPVNKVPKPSGSEIVDAVARVLVKENGFGTKELAEAMGLNPLLLNATFIVLTGMGTREFIKKYRHLQALEWLTCTDLKMQEVARRSGYLTKNLFSKDFAKQFGQAPSAYRRRFRPANFRELYEWDD